MSLEEYQSAWGVSEAGKPQPGELQELIDSIKRGERGRRVLLGLCLFYTVAAFVLEVWYVTSGRTIAWGEVTPVCALQVLLALGLAMLIRRRSQRQRELEASRHSVLEAAHAGLSHVQSEIGDVRLLALAAAVTAPTLAFVVSQLVSSGKMNEQAAWSFATVCLAVIGVNAIYQAVRYRRALAPRRDRLQRITAALSERA